MQILTQNALLYSELIYKRQLQVPKEFVYDIAGTGVNNGSGSPAAEQIFVTANNIAHVQQYVNSLQTDLGLKTPQKGDQDPLLLLPSSDQQPRPRTPASPNPAPVNEAGAAEVSPTDGVAHVLSSMDEAIYSLLESAADSVSLDLSATASLTRISHRTGAFSQFHPLHH